MDEIQQAIDLGREGLEITLMLASPLLLVGLVVGLFVSILQAATSIQEQTLSFVPKILAVVFTTMFLLPWTLTVMVEYTSRLISQMPDLFQ